MCQDMVLISFSLSFMGFYTYVSLFKIIPNYFATLRSFVFISTVYVYLLHRVFYDFSSFDLWNQNTIIIYCLIVVITSYYFKEKIKCVVNQNLIKNIFQIVSIISIHLSLYDTNMSNNSVFLYSLSFAFIFLEIFYHYVILKI